MGGLAGAVHFTGAAPDPAVVAAMAARLAHRGPDGAGDWAEGAASLAHRQRRVRATPGRQPVITPTHVVLLDGWVYEHEALARDAGHHGGGSDAEAVAHAWAAWGRRALDRIDGEFALAVWERGPGVLWLARDRIGVRPLYWARQGGRIAFASELPALTALPWVSTTPDPDTLAEYLSFSTVHPPRTFVRDVFQVEPATWLRADAKTLVQRTYWQVPYAAPGTPRPSDAGLVDELQQAVADAVGRRVPRDVPTGLYLSGGLGSSAIAAAGRDLELALPSFHVSVADDPHPEWPFASRIARLLGLDHTVHAVGSADLVAAFHETVEAMGPPVGSPGAVLQLVLARAARERVRVVLSGNGGEELFGGRMLDRVARAARTSRVLGRLPGPLRRGLGRVGGGQARALAEGGVGWALELGLGGSELFTTEERTALLRDPALVRPRVRQQVLAPFYADLATDPINAVLHAYLRSRLAAGALVRADRTAAASGLDIRFPLLDRRVVERAAALPGSAKVRRVGGSLHTRWPLRAMLSGVIPQGLVDRPKRGISAPLDRWLAGPGRLFFEDRYRRLCADPLGLWRPAALAAMRARIGEDRGAGARLWSLFLLDAWLQGATG